MKKFEIKKILVPTDFSETANNALRQAIYMARLAKAELNLLYVIPLEMNFSANIPVPQEDAYYERLKKKLLNKFNKIALKIKNENSIEVKFKVKFGVVHKEICALAETENPSLIIMGTHGVSGVTEFIAGSNAAKVVSKAICPVITIQKKSGIKGFKNIILPIRLEKNSRQKVDYVVELAKLCKATVFITGFTKEKTKIYQNKTQQYVNQVATYLSKLKINYKSTLIVGDNFTNEILLHAKNNKADLIAIMNENSFSFDQLLKGSYAKQLVNHSKIPVMSVPVYFDSDLISYSPFLSGELPGDTNN